MEQHALYGIIGHPLGHSRSPALHNWAFQALGHKGVFLSWPVEPEHLADFVHSVRLLRIQGVCVTIPHKEAIIPLLDEISPRAATIGAVNTLYWHEGKLCGENTDVDGFLLPLKQHSIPESALILGAGGAARAVVAGLQSLGIERLFISNRDTKRAQLLAENSEMECKTKLEHVDWDARADVDAHWIINTTPLGMHGVHADKSPYPATAFEKSSGLAYDLVYNPLQTRFLREARAAGWRVQDGLDMFVGQALRQMQCWTGSSTDYAETRSFLAKTLSL